MIRTENVDTGCLADCVLTTEDLLQEAQRDPKKVISRRKCSIKVRLTELNNVDLSQRLDLQDCDFRGSLLFNTKMRGAKLRGSNLSHIEMLGVDLSDADLSTSKTGRTTLLIGTQLIGTNLECANLSEAKLEEASLEGADLRGANLQSASLRKADLENTILDKTKLDRHSLGKRLPQEENGEFLDAKFIYLNLKNNFLSIGAYDDAAWAYVKERAMERKSFSPSHCCRLYADELNETKQRLSQQLHRLLRREPRGGQFVDKICVRLGEVIFRLRYLGKWLGSLLIGAPWGYGQRLQNALGICVAIIAAFTLVFWRTGGIETTLPRQLNILDYLLYSIGSFGIVGFSDMYPVTVVAKYLTVAEGFLGLTTLAIFVNALGKRIGGR
jgi:uncharacterized protein YjbI with pentapeptide repeats